MTGVQLVFTEGIASPLFECSKKIAAVSHKVDQTKQIALITVREYAYDDRNYLTKITIEDDNNTKIVDGE